MGHPIHLLIQVSGQPKTVGQEITAHLIQAIVDGDYAPGDKLPSETKLCKSLQIGRNALREALKALSLIGLIREERGRGTFVCDRSEFLIRPLSFGLDGDISMQSLTEVRQLIEVELAGLAAERGNQEEIQLIALWAGRGDNLAGLERRDEYGAVDHEFHIAIASAANNVLLSRYLTSTRNLIDKLSSREHSFPPAGWERGLSEHNEILNAICGGNSAEARQSMKRHLVGSASRLLASNRGPDEGSS